MKHLLKKYFNHFFYFYGHLRHRVFFALGLSLLVGVLDGFGLAMFLPLLQMTEGSEAVDPEGMGSLRFLVDIMDKLGIELTLLSVMAVMLFFFIMKGVAKLLEAWYRVVIQMFFINRLRFANIDKLSNFSYKSFVMADVGRIQSTLTGEIGMVVTAYRNYFQMIQAVVMVFVYVSLAFLANPQFALLVAAGGVLSNGVFRRIYKKTEEASKRRTKEVHNFQGQLIQQVAFFKYLKATALMNQYSEKLKKTISEIEVENKRMGLYNAILIACREPLVVLVVIGVILIQVSYFSQGLAVIILSLLFFYRSLNFLLTVQTHWNQFLQASGSLENMTNFMNELKQAQEKNGRTIVQRLQDSLEIKNGSFSYANKKVLNSLNVKILKNQTVAFVGESGSGKTTLVNVLAGLFPLDDGQFLIDGTDSSSIDIRTYQRRIGYITQEPVVFNDSIYNNVTFWSAKTPENISRFWEALRKANIDKFVNTLPDAENSPLGNNGIMLSGGQKQRISIARELYKDVDILILDEATSSLDSETERVILENMELLRGQYTILVVAHRLATIKNADCVVLLNNGQIESFGSFESLKRSSKLFEKMVELQEV